MDNVQLSRKIAKIANEQDRSTFIEIFDYFAPRLVGHLINSGSTKEEAEEITQDTLTTVWQKANLFNHKKGNVSTWIFTIARNRRIDRLRRKSVLDFSQDLVESIYYEDYKHDENISEDIREIQSKLNQNENNLIKMNFFEGKSHKKISEELEIPLGTVKSRIRHILYKIKK